MGVVHELLIKSAWSALLLSSLFRQSNHSLIIWFKLKKREKIKDENKPPHTFLSLRFILQTEYLLLFAFPPPEKAFFSTNGITGAVFEMFKKAKKTKKIMFESRKRERKIIVNTENIPNEAKNREKLKSFFLWHWKRMLKLARELIIDSEKARKKGPQTTMLKCNLKLPREREKREDFP